MKKNNERNNGSNLEGKSLEIGGLLQQNTNGKIEHIRRGTTTQADNGIDSERYVEEGFDYFKYIEELKEKKNEKHSSNTR